MFRALIVSSLIAAAKAQCSVCGDGKEVGNEDAIFSFPGQTSAPCKTLQQAGYDGIIPLDTCPFLPGLVRSVVSSRTALVAARLCIYRAWTLQYIRN